MPALYVPPYLPATSTPPPQGEALEDILHDVIAGITALDGTLVRPRWQPEPPDIAAEATAWCAFGFQPERSTTNFPYVRHDGNAQAGVGADTIQQHETLEVLVSFYDLGAGGDADALAAMLRDGLYIAQNREAMFAQGGLLLIATGNLTPAPVLFKERWLYRTDFTFTIRRQIDRTFSVPNIASTEILLITDIPAIGGQWDTPGQTWDDPEKTWDAASTLQVDININPPSP